MPRPLHFHVAAGNTAGVLYSIAEYSDGPKSVIDFLDISYDIFQKQIPVGRLEAESKMNALLDRGEVVNISIGQETPLMLVWSMCTCDIIPLLN